MSRIDVGGRGDWGGVVSVLKSRSLGRTAQRTGKSTSELLGGWGGASFAIEFPSGGGDREKVGLRYSERR